MTNEVLQKIASDEQNISSSNGLEPKLRFKEFDGKWSRNILGNCCDIIMGQSPDSSSYNNNCIGLPLVQGNADMCERIATPQRYTSQPTKICEAGSIILSVRAPVGTVGKTFQKICLGRGVCGITSKNIEFMYQYLLNNENSWRHIEQGGTFTAINSDDIKSFPIILPSLPEQKKIADFLSFIDQRIEKQRQLVENLKKYKRGLLSAIFDRKLRFKDTDFSLWKNVRLSECCLGFDNKRQPISSELREKGTVPYYGANGIQDYVKDYIFDGEYILLAEDGGHFDEFQTKPIAQYITGKSWVNNHAHILQATEKDCTKYIYYALVHKDIRKYINGSSRAKLNQEDMWQIVILLPNLKQQIKIAQFMSSIDKILSIEEKMLTVLEEKKQGLLQQMFI